MADKIVIEVVGNTAGLKSLTDEFNKTAKASDELNKNLLETEKEADKVDKAFKSLKTQIKEAKIEAQAMAEKFGASSKEATAAAQRVANLNDDLEDFNNRVKALNPEAKFNALNNVLGNTLGAFQGVVGAVQLFGGESKKAQEIAQKMQGALNFAQGVNSVLSMKDSFKDLAAVLGIARTAQATAAASTGALAVAETEATAATLGFNAALLANPVVWIVAALAAGAAAFKMYADSEAEAEKNADKLKQTQEDLKDIIDKVNNSIYNAIDASDEYNVMIGKMSQGQADINKNAREAGKTVEDYQKAITKALADNKPIEEALTKKQEILANDIKKAEQYAQRWKQSEKQKNDAIKILNDNYLKENKALIDQKKANDKILEASAIGISATTEAQQNKDNIAREKQRQADKRDAQQAADRRKSDREKEKAAAEKAWQEEYQLKKLKQKNEVDEAKTTQDKLALQQKFAQENYDYEKAHLEESGATATQLQILWENYYGVKLGLNAQEEKANQDKLNKELEEEQKLIDAKIALRLKQEADPVKQAQIEMDALDDKYAKILSNEKLTSTERERINLEYQKAQLDITDKVTKAVVDGEKAKQDAQQKTADDAEKQAEKRLQNEMAVKDAIVNAAGSFADIGLDITKQQLSAEEQLIKEQKDKGLISEEQYQKKLNEIKHKADVADKQAAIFKATLDFASALINALKAPTGSIPAVLALTTAVAGANLAKIIATPLPKYQKGTLSVPGIDMGRDSVHALLQPGEAVIPTAINKKYAPTIRAIYEQKISASDINSFVKGHRKGNSGELVATIDPLALGRVMNKNRTVTVENAQTIGKVIANEIGGKFNNRYII